MIQSYSLNGFTFVGAHSKLGSVTKDGPVTGKKHHVPMTGAWIDEEDAELLVWETQEWWCSRQERFLTINPIVYLSPSADQVKQLKEAL